jgi:hypothetical protein
MALEYRTARLGWCGNGSEYETGLNQTPISLNSGAWDVKHVLGEVDVEEDGSCLFKVPARQAVFFHLLDGEGKCVQSMRSWATLQPGEYFGCIGCHEPKRGALPPDASFNCSSESSSDLIFSSFAIFVFSIIFF